MNLFFTPYLLVVLYSKAVGFILYPGDQTKCLAVGVNRNLLVVKIQSSGTVMVVFYHTAHRNMHIQPGKYLLSYMDLPFSTIHKQNVRQDPEGIIFLQPFPSAMFKPSGEHFLHGTRIIRAADFPDTEFTVVILFGFSIFKHHHGSHCFKPVNIGYIVGLYPADGWHLQQFPDLFHGSRFYYERVENSRNFANKVWNASRFIMMNMEQALEKTGKDITTPAAADLQPVDKWILSKLNTLVKDVTDNMDHFELGIAVQKVYDFIWDEFCDWYIEMVKPRLYSTDDAVSQNAALWTLKTVLIDALKLLHPYMPFITEEIFCTIQNEEESIMISKWPEYSEDRAFPAEEKAIETIKEAVRGIRNIRTEMNVAPSRKASVYVVSENDEIRRIFEEGKLFFASLAYANEIMIQADKTGIAEDAVSVVIPGATLYIPFAELVDIAQEIERLKKEQKRLEGELSRSRGMLSNERFLSKAPEAKIAEEKEKLAKYEQMMEQVTKRLEQLA